MKEHLMTEIMQGMLPFLDNAQMAHLQTVLTRCLIDKEIIDCPRTSDPMDTVTNDELIATFIAAKKVEGCSEKTIRYYQTTLRKVLDSLENHVTHITTDDLRKYLSDYQEKHQCSKANIDNIRRILVCLPGWRKRTTSLKVRCVASTKSRRLKLSKKLTRTRLWSKCGIIAPISEI